MTDAAERFAEIVASYRDQPSIGLGRMMRAEGLQVHGKVFAFLSGENLIVKLPHDTIGGLIDGGRASPYLVGKRTMREWAEIPITETANWSELAEQARTFVAAGVSKQPG